MSMNYNDPSRPTTSATEDEGLLIAPVPAWERSKKRRGMLGGGLKSSKKSDPVAAETRSFDTPNATTHRDDRAESAAPMAAAGLGAMDTRTPDARAMDTRTGFGPAPTATVAPTIASDDNGLIAAPIARTSRTTTRKSKGVPGAAVALGIAALAGVGAAGWYMSQDTNDGVAELTPGVTTETSSAALATAPMAPPMPAPVAESRPTQMAQAEPARTAARASTTTTTRRATAARTRSEAPSATEAGINASGTATLPAGPQPYAPSASAGSTTGSAATTAPVTATPPVAEQPAPIPSTPPTAAEPVNPITPETPATTPAPDPTASPQ